MINTKTNDFLNNMTKLVNESELPPCVVRMALDLVRGQVAQLEVQALRQEADTAKAKEGAAGE